MGKSENYKVEKKGWHIVFLRLGISLYYYFFETLCYTEFGQRKDLYHFFVLTAIGF